MSFKEYSKYDGLGLAELIRKKEVSPEELYEEAVVRIDRVNPRLNAVITPMYEEGRATIRSGVPEGPFQGVPFLLKDLVEAYAGVRLTMGSRLCRDFVPKRDSEIVRRFKKSGVVSLGKTNVPEFGLTIVTESVLHGPCRNPWNPHHSPGGSSGGSAAAVASGIVPIASANDGGGSIRIPASFCGLFGLKPSRGRTPCGPETAEEWQGAATSHILSRSVRDSAAMLDAVSAQEIGPMYASPQNPASFLEEMRREPGRLRIAFSCESPIGSEVFAENVEAVKQTATLLENLGHDVEEKSFPIDGRKMANSFLCLVFAETAASLQQLSKYLGRKLSSREVEGPTLMIAEMGRSLSAVDLSQARRFWGALARRMGHFHEEYDLLLTPVTATPPLKIGELDFGRTERTLMSLARKLRLGGPLKRLGVLDQMVDKVLSKAPFTQLTNLTGQPSASIPLHWTEEGLPIGVQFIARFGDELGILRVAAQLESALPWFDKRPPIWSGSEDE